MEIGCDSLGFSYPWESDLGECGQVELGIDAGSLEGLMAEDIRHVFEAGTPVDHGRGGGVPENMGTQSRVPGHPSSR